MKKLIFALLILFSITSHAAVTVRDFMRAYTAVPGTAYPMTVSANVGDVIVVFAGYGTSATGAALTASLSGAAASGGFIMPAGGYAYSGTAVSGDSLSTVLVAVVTTSGIPSITITQPGGQQDIGIDVYTISGADVTGGAATALVGNATGAGILLAPSLSPSWTSSMFAYWNSETSNSFTSWTTGMTAESTGPSHYDASGYYLDLTAGTYAYGANVSTQVKNLVNVIYIKEAGAAPAGYGRTVQIWKNIRSIAASASVNCPQGNGTPTDGCSGAVASNTQYANFFTSRAAQSGQSYTTRPPWNVAGVDYPVGIPSATVLKDPSTASLPTGCTYSSNVVTCNGSGNLTINGYDFGLHNCIYLDIYNYTGTILIENSDFAMGSSTACQSNFGLIDIEASNTGSSLIVQNNVFNGNAPTYPTLANYLDIWDVGRTTGTSLYQYNAFIASIARPIETTSSGNWTAQYNYFEGLNYGNAAHGEIDMVASTATGVNMNVQFNTVLAPANYGGGATSLWYISSGSTNGQTFGTVNLKNNTEVVNLYNGSGGTVVISVADSEFGYNPVATANIANNYIDPTGAYLCYSNAGTTITTTNMSGNINLTDGSSISDFTAANCHGHH